MTSIPVARTQRLAGHLTGYVRSPLTFLHQHWKAHGDIFKFRLAHRYLIVATHPDYIKHLLQENHTNYRKSLAYRKLKLLLGNGLFTSEGSYWLQQRRLAQPAFHKERIQGYFRTMQTHTATLVEQWEGHAIRSEPVPLHRCMTEITLKIIAKTLLGIDLAEEGNVVEKHLPFALQFMMKRLTSTVNFPMTLPFPTHNRFRRSVAMLNQLIDGIIEERRAQPVPSDDLLWMLMQTVDLDTGHGMNDQQLKDEILTFFLAGHETSAVALS